MPTPTQPEPAEGSRDDAASDAGPDNTGVSAETPVEGADDSPAQRPGSAHG